ncbi:MAG TPA: hypothetical protein VK165_08020 [Azonexus sp.]|nr:hypothetical protein [Azonexus sp.]
MAKDHIGHIACPCCGEDAEVREQKNKRAYVLCTSALCGFQGFTRSTGADQGMRAKMKPKAAPVAPAPDPAPTPEPKKGFFDDIL